MIRNVYLTLAVLLFACAGALAQSGSVKGKIYDKATKEPLAFASVVAEMNGTQMGGSQSDFDGNYSIKPLQPGKYTIKISYVGYGDLVIEGVIVSQDKITFQDLALNKKVVETKEVTVEAYKVPLIEKGSTQTGATITREEIAAAPTRDVKSIASQAAGITQSDEGDAINVRGGRSGATDYYIDGVRVRGSEKLPTSGVEQVQAIVGGTPAKYGDATSGIISITTRGPSKQFEGGIEYVTSEPFDKYGYNLISANVSGPILKKKAENGSERAVLGFMLSGEYQIEKDPDPSNIGMYQLKSDRLADLRSNPVVPYRTGTGPTDFGYRLKEYYYHKDDFEKVTTKNNVGQKGMRFNTRIDFQPLENTTFAFGATYNTNDRRSFNYDRAMYNFDENPQIIETDYRGYLRLTQRIGSTFKGETAENASVFKNVYFSVQAEYQKNLTYNQDPSYKKNFWNYGWTGNFEMTRTNDSLGDIEVQVDGTGNPTFLVSDNSYSNQFSYSPVGNNSIAEAYNNIAYGFYHDQYGLIPGSPSVLTNAGGIPNGYIDLFRPINVMGISEGIGSQRSLYQETNADDYRITLSGNADIKNHSVSVGFEFEQLVSSAYSFYPRGLWQAARAYANGKYVANDKSAAPISVDTNYTAFQIPWIYYNYPEGYNPDKDADGNVINGFYENLRSGLGVSNSTYVNTDQLTPSQLSVGMFTPDELFTFNLLDLYYGYDYKGNKVNSNPSFKDFFTKKENGNYTREIGAYRPTYMAGYIQDNFAIDNLNFNIGLRVDRFDANQKQLKDKYILVDAYNVGDFPVAIAGKPSNIGNDFIPYLGVEGDYSTVIGYRKDNVWYDSEGTIVSDPDLLTDKSPTGSLAPAIKPDAGSLAASDWNIDAVFEDYKPQINVMPRVAFSFSITDQAQFFAHYDILTQRPSSNLHNDPQEYLSLARFGGDLNNAGLQSERTTDYELGFKQVLSKSSAMTISAYYREMKNMIQLSKLYYAAPSTYRTYDNIDFGTVKGLSFSYDLRRTGNVRLTAAYTLQFADGTGSGSTSNAELSDTDQPSLRFILPLDFDQRHTFTVSLDYRYKDGSDYNGPVLWGKPIFANTGANIVFKTNSGTPYTRQQTPTPEGAAIGWQSNGQRAVEGVVNGARTPWQFRVDLKIDKDFDVKINDTKKLSFNVYLQVQNLLNTKNVVNVYRATGNANDDGYLQTANGQQLSASKDDPQAFIDQYNIKMLNPDFYSLPRRARIGVAINF